MWISIASFIVGGMLGFFIACILAMSKRLSSLGPDFDELTVVERPQPADFKSLSPNEMDFS